MKIKLHQYYNTIIILSKDEKILFIKLKNIFSPAILSKIMFENFDNYSKTIQQLEETS